MDINWLRLHVANVCNFSCPGCHVFVHDVLASSTKLMSRETFVQAVESMAQILTDQGEKDLVVSVYGGEPFVNREVVHQSISQLGSECAGVRLKWVINSNGSLIDDRDIDFLKRHQIEVHFSLDGVGEIHDRTRKTLGGQGTFKRVLPNLQNLVLHGVQVQINSHIMESNIEHLESIVDLAAELEIRSVYLDISYDPQGINAIQIFKRYREVYFYAVQKGVMLSGSWSEVLRNLWRQVPRAELNANRWSLEVWPDGTYFFPTAKDLNLSRRGTHQISNFVASEYKNVKSYAKEKYQAECASCAIFSSCYGVAKEHTRYHLPQGSDETSYCEFFRMWMKEMDQPVRFVKFGSFRLTTSCPENELNPRLLETLSLAWSELKIFFPKLCANLEGSVDVHVARDLMEMQVCASEKSIPAWARAFVASGRIFCLNSDSFSKEDLKHELMHVLLSREPIQMPTWLEESLCLLVGDNESAEQEFLAEASDVSVQKILLENPKTPLIQLHSERPSKNPYYRESRKMLSRLIQGRFSGQKHRLIAAVDAGRLHESDSIELVQPIRDVLPSDIKSRILFE